MPNILLLCEFPSLSGGERSMLSTLPGLAAEGFDIAVAGPPTGQLADEIRRLDLKMRPFEVRDANGQRLSQTQAREQLVDLLRQEPPDLLHANSLAMGRLSGPVAAGLGIPSVAHLRDILRLSAAAVADLNAHTRLVAVSEATRQHHAAQGIESDKIVVAYNGINLKRFSPRAATGWLHRELDLPEGAPMVVNVGQICLRKGQEVLVAAADKLACDHPEAHFLVVGERYSEKGESIEYEENLQQAAAEGGLQGRLHLLGYREDVEKILRECTLLAHAARQEPLGRVLLEAAASGLPVVATEVGGTSEIFGSANSDDCAALLVPAGDSQALAAAIDRLLSDPRLRASLAGRARQRAERCFDQARAVSRLTVLYRELLSLH